MRIVVVSAFYSAGMGYAENCLPKYLALLGHEVHVVTSPFNVYANTPDYDVNYGRFLGPASQPLGPFEYDGYRVWRLPARIYGHHVRIDGLGKKICELRPDIVHSLEVASLATFELAALRLSLNFGLFAETHQHLSVVNPKLRTSGNLGYKLYFWLTRTLPTSLASLAVEKCYAIAPDCLEVARRWYGVSLKKLVLQSLGTDIDHFHPVSSDADRAARAERRSELGYGDLDIVAIYTGRLTDAKNPAALAGAVDRLSVNPLNIKGLFVGEGGQQTAIENSVNCQVLPFVKHEYLADLYRAADIAVWPTQESMSMLDAASTGLPLIVSNKVGEADRVSGNGKTYLEGSIDDLAQVLSSLASSTEREALGRIGRDKMLRDFSWRTIAESLERDYQRQINVKTAA